MTTSFGLTLLVSVALCLTSSGCRGTVSLPAPVTSNALDAAQITGGKITDYVPSPGLLDSPSDRALLEACRQLPLTTHSARKAYMVAGSQYRTMLVSALVVGDKTLILVGDVLRSLDIGPGVPGARGTWILYSPKDTGSITLVGGSQWATVGGRRVALRYPVVAVDHRLQLVMTLPDLLTVFHVRDTMRREHEIRNPHIIYDIRQYKP